MKDFNEHEHMTCPRCNFEVLYCDYDKRKTYYVFKNGDVDLDTGSRESVLPHEHRKIVCNHVDCNWSN